MCKEYIQKLEGLEEEQRIFTNFQLFKYLSNLPKSIVGNDEYTKAAFEEFLNTKIVFINLEE